MFRIQYCRLHFGISSYELQDKIVATEEKEKQNLISLFDNFQFGEFQQELQNSPEELINDRYIAVIYKFNKRTGFVIKLIFQIL